MISFSDPIFRFRNKKNGKIYISIKQDVINATNNNDGQIMILYCPEENSNLLYVRAAEEFYQKFEAIT